MFTVYIYVLDTLADWELGHLTAEVNSGRFFKKDAKEISLKTVSYSKKSIRTMGGMTIEPDCVIDDIVADGTSMLLLPGADTWSDPKHSGIIEKAREMLDKNMAVCAICGATVALADAGLLDQRSHTSNGAGFLEMFSSVYKGKDYFIDEQAVRDRNLITASCTGGLLWAKLILEYLDVFKKETLEAWYEYFETGKAEYFFALMQSLQ